MKAKHTKKWVLEHVLKNKKGGRIDGYIPYEGSYLFCDNVGFIALLNCNHGFKQCSEDYTSLMKRIIDGNRPEAYIPPTQVSCELACARFTYIDVLNHSTESSMKVGNAWYAVHYLQWACELLRNDSGEFELFYSAGNSLSPAWIFKYDKIKGNEAILIFPVRRAVQ